MAAQSTWSDLQFAPLEAMQQAGEAIDPKSWSRGNGRKLRRRIGRRQSETLAPALAQNAEADPPLDADGAAVQDDTDVVRHVAVDAAGKFEHVARAIPHGTVLPCGRARHSDTVN